MFSFWPHTLWLSRRSLDVVILETLDLIVMGLSEQQLSRSFCRFFTPSGQEKCVLLTPEISLNLKDFLAWLDGVGVTEIILFLIHFPLLLLPASSKIVTCSERTWAFKFVYNFLIFSILKFSNYPHTHLDERECFLFTWQAAVDSGKWQENFQVYARKRSFFCHVQQGKLSEECRRLRALARWEFFLLIADRHLSHCIISIFLVIMWQFSSLLPPSIVCLEILLQGTQNVSTFVIFHHSSSPHLSAWCSRISNFPPPFLSFVYFLDTLHLLSHLDFIPALITSALKAKRFALVL